MRHEIGKPPISTITCNSFNEQNRKVISNCMTRKSDCTWQGRFILPKQITNSCFFLFSFHKLSLNFLGWFNLTIQIVCYGTQIAFGKQETHFWTVIQTRRGLVLNFQAFLPGMGVKFTVLWHDTVQNGLIFHVRLHYKNHNKVKRYWVTIFGNDMRHKNEIC